MPMGNLSLSAFDHVWLVSDFKKDTGAAVHSSIVTNILGSYLPKSRIKFSYNSFGKPVLVPIDGLSLYINLSHSKSLLVAIVSLDTYTGIDVEEIKERRYAARIASRYFHGKSLVDLIGFYRSWTACESFIKAHGLSIGSAISRIAVKDDTDDLYLGLDGAFSHRVQFFRPTKEHLLAVCRPQTSPKELAVFHI
jgi:phosphopantetheinyl transferase